MDQLWKVWLGAGVLIALIYTAVVEGDAVRPAAFTIVGLISVSATIVGLMRNQPAGSLPWRLAIPAMLCFIVGELVFRWLQTATEFPAFPSLADVFYLATYPFLVAGIVTAGYRANNPRHIGALVAAFTVGAIVSIRMWQSFVGEMTSYEVSTLAQVVGLAYPGLAVAVLVAASYTLLAATSHRSRVLAVAGLTMFAAEYLYNHALHDGTFTLGGVEDFLWLLTFVVIAASALVPADKSTQTPACDTDSGRRPALAEH